jgi:ribonuclease P protein component
VKRRIRSAFSEMNITDGWDVVVTAKPDSSIVSYEVLEGAIQKSIARLGIDVPSPSPRADSKVVV